MFGAGPPARPGRIAPSEARYDAAVARLLTALAMGPFLTGDRFTAVDVMIASVVARGRDYIPGIAPIDAWLERSLNRPAHARALAKDSALPRLVQAA